MEQTKTISSHALLQRTSSIFGLTTSNWYLDGIDWIGQAIQAIGYHVGFVPKKELLKVSNYRCYFPSSIERITKVEYNGTRLVLGVDDSSYDLVVPEKNDTIRYANYEDVVKLDREIERLNQLQLIEPKTDEIINAIIDTNKQIDLLARDLRLGRYANDCNFHYYNIEGEFLKFNFSTGNIVVTGQGFPTDDKGFPLVVSTFKYEEAISWFLMYRLCLQGNKHPELNWKECLSMYEDYRYQASNEAKMPNIDQLERFTRGWTSIKREVQLNIETL